MNLNQALEAWLDAREAERQAPPEHDAETTPAQQAAATFAAMFDQLDKEHPAPPAPADDDMTADDLMAAIREDSTE